MGAESVRKAEETATPALALVVIRSADLARAERFYSALGLTFAREKHSAGPEHLVCRLGSTIFEIYPLKKQESATASVRLGFAVPSLEHAIEATAVAGGKLLTPPEESPWGRRVVLIDPDGHRIELKPLGNEREENHNAAHDPNPASADGNDAQSFTPNPSQIKILNVIASYQLANSADISGKRLRAGMENLGIEKNSMDALIDIFVRAVAQMLPDDRYKLTLWGWVFSEHATKVHAIIDGVLGLFRAKYREDPDFAHYSRAELGTPKLIHEESEQYFVGEILDEARLCGGKEGDAWRVPADVEALRELKDSRDFLEQRWNSFIGGRVRVAKAQRRLDFGFEPFDESNDGLIDEMEKDPSLLDTLAAFGSGEVQGVAFNLHSQGDMVLGSKNTSNVRGSTVGAVAVGEKSRVKGNGRSSTSSKNSVQAGRSKPQSRLRKF